MPSVNPLCPVFGSCGGCQHQDISYDEELCLKEIALRGFLSPHFDVRSLDIRPVVPSPKVYHYRSRLDLKLVRTRRGTVHIGFSPPEKGPVVEVNACPIAMEQISRFLPQLAQDALRKLPAKYRMANLTVRCGEGDAVQWGGIGRRSLRLEEKDYFSMTIALERHLPAPSVCPMPVTIYYSLDTFFQANLSILPVLAKYLRALPVWSKEAVFFDLYGGGGLFSIMMHDLVKGVVNIEENTHSVTLARFNVDKNSLANAVVHEGRVEDILPSLLESSFSGENIVMVDPPRAGLSPAMIGLLNQLTKVRHLLYLSCNPQTLASNLVDLTHGPWRTVFVQPFDFFPRTRHLETLVLLRSSSQK